MIESHIAKAISEQLDYYVDAYRRCDSLSRRCADLSERLAVAERDMYEAGQMRDHAAQSFNKLIEDITDEADVKRVEEMVASRLNGIVDSMVVL